VSNPLEKVQPFLNVSTTQKKKSTQSWPFVVMNDTAPQGVLEVIRNWVQVGVAMFLRHFGYVALIVILPLIYTYFLFYGV